MAEVHDEQEKSEIPSTPQKYEYNVHVKLYQAPVINLEHCSSNLNVQIIEVPFLMNKTR